MTTIGLATIIPFLGLFALFIALDFMEKLAQANLNDIYEWSLAGRNLYHTCLFLLGAGIYTAYTFVAIPSGVFAKGLALFFCNSLCCLSIWSGACYYAQALGFVERKRLHLLIL